MAAKTTEPDLFSRAHASGAPVVHEFTGDTLTPKALVLQRHSHPAWQLLASPRAPLVLGCLKPLFDAGISQIPLDDAREQLTRILGSYANDSDYEIDTQDLAAFARKELRTWIQKGLLAERGGDIFATDSLQTAFRFIEGIQHRMMTSTASRLLTVQQKIESLEASLNPVKETRIQYLESKIAELQSELKATRQGKFKVLEGEQANEEIREVFNLAMSLSADFRRVEDSYRDADRELRQSIISEDQHRGEVLDRLLDSNEALLKTPEGRVFHGFYEQIIRSNELDEMRGRIRMILSLPSAEAALSRKQANELRSLVSRLIEESQLIMQARTRSEKDVRGFIKTGLAGEHHRVGDLLQQIFETVLQIDWSKQAVRRAPSTLLPIAPANPTFPCPERLEYKSVDDVENTRLNLKQQEGSLDALAESFLENSDELDRTALYESTLQYLKEHDHPHTIGALAQALPPAYDLESIAFWISLAREAGATFETAIESIDLIRDDASTHPRFKVPTVRLVAANIEHIPPETLE